MKKLFILAACSGLIFTSCVSKKQYADMEAKQKETQDLLNSATVKLNDCLEERSGLRAENKSLKSQNQQLITQVDNFTTLTKTGASNLEKSLESLKEKDLTISKLRDAVTRRDSVNLALVQSLKGALGDLTDTDIEVSVDKGVVIVNISDKLLFASGSTRVNQRAREVLGKVATVVNAKPDFDFIVEGHTDDVPIQTELMKDNWDLSVLRATAVVRILQNDYDVDPKRMTAGGRSKYIPVASNDSADGRAKNRRTRIAVLPKIDQFYAMIQDGMKDPNIND